MRTKLFFGRSLFELGNRRVTNDGLQMAAEENPYRSPASDVTAQRDETLRMYGIFPRQTPPPRGPIRSTLTTGNIVGQWIAFLLFGIGPIALELLLLAVVPVLAVSMTNVRELVERVVSAVYRFGEVVPEIVELDGSPLIRRLTLRRMAQSVSCTCHDRREDSLIGLVEPPSRWQNGGRFGEMNGVQKVHPVSVVVPCSRRRLVTS